jgi:hypothetical protein
MKKKIRIGNAKVPKQVVKVHLSMVGHPQLLLKCHIFKILYQTKDVGWLLTDYYLICLKVKSNNCPKFVCHTF